MNHRARALLAMVTLVSCGHTRTPVLHAVVHAELPHGDARPTASAAAPLAAIVELGDAVIVLGGHHVTVLRGNVVTATTDTELAWLAGTTIAAPDGDGRWAVGLADDHTVWRVMLTGEIELVGDRLGIGADHAFDIFGVAGTTAAALDGAVVATIDGVHLARIDHAVPRALAVARGRLALADARTVELWDLARGTSIAFPIAGAVALAFIDAAGDAPRLAIATESLLYVERGGAGGSVGALQRVALPSPIATIAAAGARLWIRAGHRLFALDGDALASIAGADAVATGDAVRLFGAADGDVWAASAAGATRYGVDHGGNPADAAWQASIAPVFARVCAHCHLPGGDAGIDLSTPASWLGERDELRRRVLVTQTMPPAGTLMSDDDRAAIATWLGAPAPATPTH